MNRNLPIPPEVKGRVVNFGIRAVAPIDVTWSASNITDRQDTSRAWILDGASAARPTYMWLGGLDDGKLLYTGMKNGPNTDDINVGSIVITNNGPVVLYPKLCQHSGGPLIWSGWDEDHWKVLDGELLYSPLSDLLSRTSTSCHSLLCHRSVSNRHAD